MNDVWDLYIQNLIVIPGYEVESDDRLWGGATTWSDQYSVMMYPNNRINNIRLIRIV